MDVGAIVIVEAQRWIDESPSPSVAELDSATVFAAGTFAFVDLLGRCLLERIIEP